MSKLKRPVPATQAPRAGHPTFSARKGDFFSTVNERAHAYFTERGIDQHASTSRQIVSILLIAAVPALLYPAYVRGFLLGAVLLGVVRSVAVLGPGHSASHL